MTQDDADDIAFRKLRRWSFGDTDRQWILEKWRTGYECKMFYPGGHTSSHFGTTISEAIDKALRAANGNS